MKRRLIIGLAVIAIGVLVAFTAFQDSLTAYVGFDEARRLNKNCQVMGEIVKEAVAYDPASGALRFPIKDQAGDRLDVYYIGVVPGNFEQAKDVVAIGRYHQGRFEAERLLVKCPSKYQGMEEKGEQNPHEAKVPRQGT